MQPSDANIGSTRQTGEVCVVGVPSSPPEFVSRAVAAGHPKELKRHNAKLVTDAVRANFVDTPERVKQVREAFFLKWEKRAVELEPFEKAANAKRPEHLQHLLENKRILLFREILDSLGYPDKGLTRDIENGFALYGWLPNTGVFEPCVRKPAFSLETLKMMAHGLKEAVKSRLVNRQVRLVEEATWDETKAELQRGWLWIPQRDLDVTPKIYAMRFGLQQKDKLRVIDDCSVGGLNATIGVPEKLRVHSVDVLLNFLVNCFEVTPGGMPAAVGRTYDLKSAYKQFGVDSVSRDLLRIMVNVPGQTNPEEIGVQALPFGSVGSVGGFLRVSVAVWFIGLAALALVWSAFYDDFTCVCREELVKSTDQTITGLLNLLGLDFAQTGKKAPPFSACFRTLGVQVDLSDAKSHVVTVGHTLEGREEIASFLKGVLDTGVLTAKQAEQLMGRMIFFESYTFGRTANFAVKALGVRAESSSGDNVLDQHLRFCLELLLARVQTAGPLVITPSVRQTFFVFTDGAFEQGRGTVGGILYDSQGCALEFFSLEIAKDVMDLLLANSKNPIYELEVLPVAISLALRAHRMKARQVLAFLDNSAALVAFLKGSGATALASNMVRHAMQLESDNALVSWYSRVPSASNPADKPSKPPGLKLLSAW